MTGLLNTKTDSNNSKGVVLLAQAKMDHCVYGPLYRRMGGQCYVGVESGWGFGSDGDG